MEVVRRFVEASVRRDRDAFVALLDPEFKGFPPPNGRSPPRFVGAKRLGSSDSSWKRLGRWVPMRSRS
jgi:hypothetical protein